MPTRVLLLFLFLPEAQALFAAPPRVEIFGGGSFWLPALDTVYDASYTPSRVVGIGQLFVEPDPRSQARELLGLDGATSLGLSLGVNVYPHRTFGLQFLFDRANVKVGGDEASHQVHLTYDTIAFPSPTHVVRELDYSFDVPPTDGHLRESTLHFNAVARFGASGPVEASISGGLSYYRFQLEADEIQAFAAWLGGHAVVFSELYEMSYETRSEDGLGWNAGAQVSVAVGRHFALFVDGRYFKAPVSESEPRLVGLVSNPRFPVVVEVPLDQIESFLALPGIRIDPSYLRFAFGLKWKL